MADSRIIIELTGRDNASAVFKSAQNQVAGSVKSMEVSVTSSLSQITSRWGQFISVFAAAQGMRGLTETATEIDSISQRLKFATGGVDEASKAWRFLETESDRLGLNLKTMSSEFGSLAAAAKGTSLAGEGVQEIFLAVSEAASVMSLSEDKASAAFLALTQMISKGKIQAEEVTQQFSEAFPGALGLFARALNKTEAEFFKFMEAGLARPAEVLPKVAAQLRYEVANDLAAASNSFRANLNRMETAWFGLKRAVVQGGFGPAATGAIQDLTNYLKRLSDQIKSSDDVAIFFSNLAEAGKAIGGIVVPAIGEFVKVLGSLSRAYNELPDVFRTGTGTGLIALLLTRNPQLAVGAGTFSVLNQAMEQLNQQMKVDMLPTIQHGGRQWDIYSKSVQNVIDVLTGVRDWNTGYLKGGPSPGDFMSLESGISGGSSGLTKTISAGLDAVMKQIEDIQKRKADLLSDPLGRVASGNADADAQNRVKAITDARQASEERINALLQEREQILSGGAEREGLQQDLDEANAYYQQIQKIIADIKQSGTSFTTGFGRADLGDLLAEAAEVKAFMDETTSAIQEQNVGYQQQAAFLVERAIYEEQQLLRTRQLQEQEAQRAVVAAQVVELQKSLASGNITDSKVQSEISALLKTQSTEQKTISELTTKRADVERQMASLPFGEKWLQLRDSLGGIDEQLTNAQTNINSIAMALQSVPDSVSVKLAIDDADANTKLEQMRSMYMDLSRTIYLDLNTDKASMALQSLMEKIIYIQNLTGGTYTMNFEGSGSPSMSFSAYYDYLLDKLANLPKGSQYTVDFLTQQGGMDVSGAASVMQQYDTLSKLQSQLSQAYKDLEYYQRNTYIGYAQPSTGAMASYYEQTVIPRLQAEIQQASLAMMSVAGGGWSGGSTARASSSVSSGASGGVTININTINVNASGSGRDAAISAASSIDAEIAALIKSNRSQIKAALGS